MGHGSFILCPLDRFESRTLTARHVGRRADKVLSACTHKAMAARTTSPALLGAQSVCLQTSEPAMKPKPSPRREETDTQRGAVKPQGPALPHERDQQNRSTDSEPNRHIERAAKDLKEGQVDTDLRATPGLDANVRGGLVPGGERSAGDRKPRPGR